MATATTGELLAVVDWLLGGWKKDFGDFEPLEDGNRAARRNEFVGTHLCNGDRAAVFGVDDEAAAKAAYDGLPLTAYRFLDPDRPHTPHTPPPPISVPPSRHVVYASALDFPEGTWARKTLLNRAAQIKLTYLGQEDGQLVFQERDEVYAGKRFFDVSPMYRCILAGDVDGVRQQVTRHSHDPSYIFGWMSTLIFAIKHRQLEVFLALLDLGADPNSFHRTGKTPLHAACALQWPYGPGAEAALPFVAALLSCPGIVVDPIRFGFGAMDTIYELQTPLGLAFSSHFGRAVRLLVDAGASTAWMHDPATYQPHTYVRLHDSVGVELLQWVLGHDAAGRALSRPIGSVGSVGPGGPGRYDDSGFRYLVSLVGIAVVSSKYLADLAAAHNLVLTTKTLEVVLQIPSRADVLLEPVLARLEPGSVVDPRKVLEVLQQLYQDAHREEYACRLLDRFLGLTASLSPSAKIFCPRTALVTKGLAGVPAAAVRRLCAAVGDPSAMATVRDGNNNTPLHVLLGDARRSNMLKSVMEGVKVLVECGVDVHAVNTDGQTCLHAHAAHGLGGCTYADGFLFNDVGGGTTSKEDAVCVLCQLIDVFGADPCVMDAQGNTFLHLTSKEVASTIVMRCAGIRNARGHTPLAERLIGPGDKPEFVALTIGAHCGVEVEGPLVLWEWFLPLVPRLHLSPVVVMTVGRAVVERLCSDPCSATAAENLSRFVEVTACGGGDDASPALGRLVAMAKQRVSDPARMPALGVLFWA